jgi:phospholipid/cholesterol/gamma-HCH transport system ATP-binding protein
MTVSNATSHSAPLLTIEHLKKHFGNQLVLDDINLEVKKGEIVCIIGQSGGGKSVILKHIIGLIIPDGGRVLLDGEEISSPTKKPSDFNKVRRRLGMLFQGAALFDSKSVGENIAFPLREHTAHSEEEIQSIIAEALEMVGLQKNFQYKMPSELSGGMKSRVGLARALVMKPEIMLYDEPTSALDPIMTDKINELILSLRDKLAMTSVVVTHDMASAYRIADTIAMIYEGKIVFCGTPAQIRATRNPYIQQFIRGQRKLHYAVSAPDHEGTALDRQVDVGELKQRLTADKRIFSGGTENRGRHDSLAGMLTADQFNEVLESEAERSLNNGDPLALVLCAVDSLESLNARFGAEIGDAALAETGKRLSRSIRGTDYIARLDKNEFALILTKTNPDVIQKTVEGIQQRSAGIMVRTKKGDCIPITLSFGVALPGEIAPDVVALVKKAGEAVRKARKNGTAQIVVNT